MTDEIETPQAAPAADLTPGTRALLRTVYIMGIVLVLLLITLIGGIIWKATNRTPKASEAASVFDLGLEPGVAVTGVERDGDRMAVTTSEGSVVVDRRRRRVEARIGLRP